MKETNSVKLYLSTIKTHENLRKNVNENMFSFTFYANFHRTVTAMFTKM